MSMTRGAAGFLSESKFVPPDDFELQIAVQLREVRAVPGDAHQQVRVVFRWAMASFNVSVFNMMNCTCRPPCPK